MQRERGVSLDTDWQGDGRVDVQGVLDAGQWTDLTEPSHLPDPDSSGLNGHRSRGRQHQQWPRTDRPPPQGGQRGLVRIPACCRSGLVFGPVLEHARPAEAVDRPRGAEVTVGHLFTLRGPGQGLRRRLRRYFPWQIPPSRLGQ